MVLLKDKIIGQSKDDNLEGIKVEIEDVEKKEVYTTTTDKDGNYSMFIPERLIENAQKATKMAGVQSHPHPSTNSQVANINSTTSSTNNNVSDPPSQLDNTKNYTVRIQKPGYETKEIPLTQRTEQQSERLPVSIDKLEVGNILNTTIVYFDFDRYTITNQAKRELDIIVRMMNDNPEMVLETFSYTDCRASETYNITLSNNRAKATIEYIQERISNPKRIYGKGYGQANPIVDCRCHTEQPIDCAEEEHRLNRRTEFKIIKL